MDPNERRDLAEVIGKALARYGGDERTVELGCFTWVGLFLLMQVSFCKGAIHLDDHQEKQAEIACLSTCPAGTYVSVDHRSLGLVCVCDAWEEPLLDAGGTPSPFPRVDDILNP